VKDYRAAVGPPDKYDIIGALQFSLLCFLGLRDTHTLLDIGCGSLRGGRLFIPYLMPGKYFGVEPNTLLVDDGLEYELGGSSIVRVKSPAFTDDNMFFLSMYKAALGWPAVYDFLLAQSIFSHAPARQVQECMMEANRVMHDKSVFVATYFIGDDYQGDKWVSDGIASYHADTMFEFAAEANLVASHIKWPHPSGQKWFLMTKSGEVMAKARMNLPSWG
jgi:SAM-dependent methyltransferase